jgi:hypothetical protein
MGRRRKIVLCLEEVTGTEEWGGRGDAPDAEVHGYRCQGLEGYELLQAISRSP